MDLELDGFNVLVLGGTTGIGAAIVKRFAAEGANVAFCSRSAAHVQRMLDDLAVHPVAKTGVAIDVTDSAAFSGWLSTLAKIDVFVPAVSAISADWNASIAVDMHATVGCVEAVVPVLRRSEYPAITYIGSKAATFAMPGFEAYGAVKAAMTHYMKSLSARLMCDRIRVNTVSPGDTFVEGGFWDRIRVENPALYSATLAANPLGRFCAPEEIADTVAFLSSPKAGFITGSNLLMDGGTTAHVHG